jgi:hypothetical protein
VSLYQEFDMQYCDRCKGQRPHSKRGRCLAAHRTTQLATVTPLKRTEFKGGYPAGDKTAADLKAPPPALQSPRSRTPKPRRNYNQDTVHTVIAALLNGTTTLQQGCRDIGGDPKYLHKRAWESAKKASLARDGGVCQYPDTDPGSCGGLTLDCHHRITKGSGGSSNPLVAYYLPNLLTLCRTHHTYVTGNPVAGMALGLVIPRIVHDPAHVMANTINGLVLLNPDGSRTLVAPSDQEAS